MPINRLPRWLLLPVLVVLLALAPPSQADDEPALRVGFAEVDLTPDKPVPLAGYAARKGALSTGVHDKIMARAIALVPKGGLPIVIVSLDLVGVTFDVRVAVAAKLGQSWEDNIDPPLGRASGPRLILTATHTHSGPGGLTDIPLWRPMVGAFDATLRDQMIDRIAACVRKSLEAPVPATVRSASARVASLQRNRRRDDGPLAPDLGVLRIEDLDRKLIGAVVHYAAHPTILSAEVRELSADWPGAVVRHLQAGQPGLHVQMLAGALGDIAPRVPAAEEGQPDGPFDRVERYGAALGAKAKIVLDAASEAMALPAPRYGEVQIHQPTIAAALLGRTTRGGLAPRDIERVPVPFGTLYFDATHQLQFVPGEPVAALEELLAPRGSQWVVACANDHLGYFTDRRAFRVGGYEAEMTFFDPSIFDYLVRPTEFAKLSNSPLARDSRSLPLVTSRNHGKATTARGLGVRHGRLLRREINELLTEADKALRKHALGRGAAALLTPFAKELGVPSEELVIPFLVRAARKLQQYIPEEYLDEMEGVARGAGVPYDAILLENTFLTLAEQTNPVKLLDLPARCTNVVAFGESTSMGQLIHASTLDWGLGDVLGPRAMPILYEPAKGHPFVSITWPGMVGTLRAMGAQGISITEESTAAPKDTGMSGIPINFLMRQTVQHANTLDDAVTRVKTAPGTCGYKVTIASGQALDARVVEVTARHHHVRRPIKGLLCGCDPDAPPEAYVGPRDGTIPRDEGSSRRRYPALRHLLAQAPGTLRLPLLTHALSQTADGILNKSTLIACAFEPQILRVHVAVGDDVDFEAGELHFQTHDLFANLPAASRARYTTPPPVTTTGTVETTPSKHKFAGLEILDVKFDSPVTTGTPKLDRVEAQLFLPDDALGVVIELPAWKERTLAAHRMLAMQLAKHRIATLVLPLPGQVSRRPDGTRPGQLTLSDNLATTRRSFIQGLTDVRRASLYLEQTHGFAPDRQAISGISLGGHAAALAMGLNPKRFRAGVFILAGAKIQDAFLNENPITGGITRALRKRGVHRAESATMIGAMEPARVADKQRAADVLLIAADKDEVIAPANARLLAAAWGGARIEWLQGGHYAILGAIPRVVKLMAGHLTTAFQPK